MNLIMAIGKRTIAPATLGALAASAAAAQGLNPAETVIAVGAAAVFGAMAQTGKKEG